MNELAEQYRGMPNSQVQQDRIYKFDLLCDNLPSWIAISNLFIASGLIYFVPGELPLVVRLTWLFITMLLTLARGYYLYKWKKTPTTPQNINTRINGACGFAFSMSALFGCYEAIAIMENDLPSTTLVILLSAGMSASAAVSLGHVPVVYACTTIPMLLPVALRMLTFTDTLYHVYSSLIILFLIFGIHVSRSTSKSVSQSISMRFENRDLLADLQLEKSRTQKLLSNLQQEKNRAEEALHREAQANISKSQFLAAASHDLRQPLNSLRLFTSTLELQTRDTQHRALASQIDESVETLEELFNGLLDISKLDAGILPVNHQPTDLSPVLKRISDDFQPLAARKGLEFRTSFDSHVAVTDPLLLERLLRNLLNNAIRYTAKGSVSLSTTVIDDCVEIAIADTGLGIRSEDQSRIFEEFVQLDNPSRDKDQGIGLGLSIVKRVADLLDIPVSVESAPGVGSTFSLRLKLSTDSIGDTISVKASAEAEVCVNAIHVLIIDDDERTCSALEGLLQAWGCGVTTATSGDLAIAQIAVEDKTPDVIISDYRLKNFETGGDAIRSVCDYLDTKVPAIVLTGDISPERLLEIRELGYPMLHKPCKSIALRKLIAQEVGRISAPIGLEV